MGARMGSLSQAFCHKAPFTFLRPRSKRSPAPVMTARPWQRYSSQWWHWLLGPLSSNHSQLFGCGGAAYRVRLAIGRSSSPKFPHTIQTNQALPGKGVLPTWLSTTLWGVFYFRLSWGGVAALVEFELDWLARQRRLQSSKANDRLLCPHSRGRGVLLPWWWERKFGWLRWFQKCLCVGLSEERCWGGAMKVVCEMVSIYIIFWDKENGKWHVWDVWKVVESSCCSSGPEWERCYTRQRVKGCRKSTEPRRKSALSLFFFFAGLCNLAVCMPTKRVLVARVSSSSWHWNPGNAKDFWRWYLMMRDQLLHRRENT